MTDLKSLAHPEWPYTGTAHEWRGFVKAGDVGGYYVHTVDPANPWIARGRYVRPSDPDYCPTAVYQKQNFGPELK
jgi:hypothetical protein